MHTTLTVIGGLVLLLACIGAAHVAGRASWGALVFLPVWLAGSGVNMYFGVRAGHAVSEEIPFLLLVFAVPAAVALAAWWALGHS